MPTLDTILNTILSKAPTKALWAALVMLVAVVPVLPAATIVWDSATSGTFSEGANWTGDVAPTASNIANFNKAGTYTVTFTDNATVQAVTVNDGDGAQNLTFALGGFTLTSSGAQFLMNQDQANTLTLNNGTLNIATTEARVGNSSTSTGMQTIVVGADAQLLLTGSSSMRLGNSGNGTVRVEAGGVFDADNRAFRTGLNATGNGLLTVTGEDSVARFRGTFTVGENGTGRVEVLNGGLLERSGTGNLIAQIGQNAGNGALVVDGADSVARLRNVYVGGDSSGNAGGTGLLQASNGGLISVSLTAGDGTGIFRVYGGGTVDIDGGRIEAKEGVLFDAGSTFSLALRDQNANPFDITNGGITLATPGDGVTLDLSLGAGFDANIGDTFTLLTYKGALDGTFAGLGQGDSFSIGASSFEIDYGFGTDSAITLTVIPEPGTLMMMGLGAGALMFSKLLKR